MREIKISIETAQRWANGTDKELKGLALQTYPELAKKELPKSWEEFEYTSGWVSTTYGGIQEKRLNTAYEIKNIFATQEQAEASIALAQLSQLREVYRNGWIPDWSDAETKHGINFYYDKIRTENWKSTGFFLSFQDEQTRDLFLENFRELIEKAKPLMS